MTVVPVWLVACVGLTIAIRVTAARPDAVPLTVIALPMVLLVLVAPVPVESVRAIRAFQDMSAQGGSTDMARVVEMASGMLEPFQTALWLALSVLLGASAVAWSRRKGVVTNDGPEATGSRLSSGSWMLLSGIAGAGVVTVLLLFVAGVPSLVMEAGEAFAGVQTAARGRLTPTQYADAISTRLIVGVVGGATAAGLTALLGTLVTLLAGRAQRTRLTDTMSWPAVTVVGLLLAAGLVSVTRALSRFAALALP